MKKFEFKVMAWLRAIREKQAKELKGQSSEARAAYYRNKAQAIQNAIQHEKVTV